MVRWMALVVLLCGCSSEQPLPEGGDITFLLRPSSSMSFGADSVGGHGVVLPRAVFDMLEAPTRVDEPDDLYRNLSYLGVLKS